jgi:hypothetical protein
MFSRRGLLLSCFQLLAMGKQTAVTMGEVAFEIIRNGKSPRRYLLIHGDEETAREVLKEHMKTHRGTALLVTGKSRTIESGAVKFDPNRMFSREGMEKNLARLNPGLADADRERVLKLLDRDRGKIIARVAPPKGGLLIALHNNARGYSMTDEIAISDKTSLADEANPHEFMLCTSLGDFEILAKSPFNVLLQSTGPKEDDGSFSRLAAKRGIRYVNIECAIGKIDRQREILNWVETHLP